ncbi:hypothetical protein FHS27_002807 [Rhodopirellula rubra]|uniref:Uncharacterized protein n=1 Tax=Aporhodopirellula rubra TaxID=980271 RepID=A0A7W5H674_9BACT|nr:hypothetical protein [Aporhodopirellula rubra]
MVATDKPISAWKLRLLIRRSFSLAEAKKRHPGHCKTDD